MNTTIRATSSIRIVDDGDQYRLLSMEGEADPTAAMELRIKRRFRDNIHLQESVIVPLERIRVASVVATSGQAEEFNRALVIPDDVGPCEFTIPLPFAEFEGTVYLYGQGLQALDAEQLLQFFTESLYPGLKGLGVNLETARPVFVFNRLT